MLRIRDPQSSRRRRQRYTKSRPHDMNLFPLRKKLNQFSSNGIGLRYLQIPLHTKKPARMPVANFKLLIAGDGELNNELRSYAKKLQVENEVVFLGFVENIKTFMNSIDIFLLTSLWEGFGYVIVEAMACNKPTVAFNVSSNPEIIADKKTGFLIDDFNIDEFTDKIDLLINDNELREKFGNKAREIVEKRFEIDNTVKQIEQILY